MNGKKVGLAVVLGVAAVAAVACVAVLTTRNSQDEEGLTYQQRALRVLERMPVIDGHNDFPWNLRKLVFNDLSRVNFNSDLTQVEPWKSHPESFTDIPRLRAGRVGGQFWVAYTACDSNYKDSVAQTLEQIDVIKRLAAEYDDLHFATSAADIETAIDQGKIASLIAVEGGHSIQSSVAILRLMYELGARYMTLTHSCNLPWADASPVDRPDDPLPAANDGLSEYGLKIIGEMNRLGMMIDLSHVSVQTMNKSIAWSKAPVIFSHSSAKAICDHHRNVPDEILEKVAVNKGIVMVNFFTSFVQCNSSLNATIQDVVDHINHIKLVAGVDHIGIGADFDGVDSVPEGLEDVSKYPALFEALLADGWAEEDLEKLAGRNLIRVFKEVERVRDSLQFSKPEQEVVKKADVERAGINLTCVTSQFPDEVSVKNETEIILEANETDEQNSTVRNKRHVVFSPEESAEL